ncbi:family 1 glycosylhydrolase [Siculibacillus lacustris]|uniref:family 1 glycosylhydrolase n=1 Tax=Siculibacillus lacustris TaxID=1549641 RepID=UPI0038998DF9
MRGSLRGRPGRGAWQAGGVAGGWREPAIRDDFTKEAGRTLQGSDVAVDHHHRFREDVALTTTAFRHVASATSTSTGPCRITPRSGGCARLGQIGARRGGFRHAERPTRRPLDPASSFGSATSPFDLTASARVRGTNMQDGSRCRPPFDAG